MVAKSHIHVTLRWRQHLEIVKLRQLTYFNAHTSWQDSLAWILLIWKRSHKIQCGVQSNRPEKDFAQVKTVTPSCHDSLQTWVMFFCFGDNFQETYILWMFWDLCFSEEKKAHGWKKVFNGDIKEASFYNSIHWHRNKARILETRTSS